MDIYTSYISKFGSMPTDRPLAEIIEEIRTGTYKDKIQEIREEVDTVQQQILESHLPFFLPSLQVKGVDRITEDSVPTGLVQMEQVVEDNPNVDLDKIRDAICNLPETIYCYYSPRNELKFAVRTDFKKNKGDSTNSLKERYRQAYTLVKRHVLECVSLKLNYRLQNIKQACFMSVDPDAYFNQNCSIFHLNEQCVYKPYTKPSYTYSQLPKNQIIELLKYIPNDFDYDNRVPVNFAVLKELGEAGIPLLMEHWTAPTDRIDLEKKLKAQLKDLETNPKRYGNIDHLYQIALDNGFKEISGHTLDELVSKEDAQKQVDEIIDNGFKDGKSVFINVSTGLGKTKSMLELIKKLSWKKQIHYLVKDHKLAEEIISKYKEAGQPEDENWLKGVSHIKGRTKLCLFPDSVKIYTDANLTIPWQTCQGCKHFTILKDCPYISQFTNYNQLGFVDINNVNVMTHNDLFNEPPAWWYGVDGGSPAKGNRQPDLIVVDEDCLKFDAQKETLNTNWKSIRKVMDDVDDGLGFEDAIHKRREKIISDYEEMLEQKTLKPKYDNSNEQYLKEMEQFNGEYHHSEILRAFNDYLITGDTHEIDRMRVFENNKKKLELHLYRILQIHERYKDVPKLFLDATANEMVIKAVFPDVEFHSIKVKADKDINVYQMENKLITKEWLMDSDHRDMLVETMMNFKEKYEKVGFITYKNLKEYPSGKMVIADFDEWLAEKTDIEIFGHFGGIRGRDEFENVDCLVIIGRHTPRVQDLLNYATAVFGRIKDVKSNMVIVPFRMKDGSVKELINYRYKDIRMEAVKDHLAKAETIQAIGRGRMIWGKKKDIFIFSKESLGDDIEVTEFIKYEDYFKKRPFKQQIEKIKEQGYCRDYEPDLLEMGFNISAVKKRNDTKRINNEILEAGIPKITVKIKNIESRKVLVSREYYVYDMAKLDKHLAEDNIKIL